MVMTEKVIVVMPTMFIKSKTNLNEFAKQYYTVIKSESMEASLIIRKLVLSDNFRLYESYNLLKMYNGIGLFELRFSIKLSTLNIVIETINRKN